MLEYSPLCFTTIITLFCAASNQVCSISKKWGTVIGLLIECGHVVMILIREAAPSPTFLGTGPPLRPPCPGLSAAHCVHQAPAPTRDTPVRKCVCHKKNKNKHDKTIEGGRKSSSSNCNFSLHIYASSDKTVELRFNATPKISIYSLPMNYDNVLSILWLSQPKLNWLSMRHDVKYKLLCSKMESLLAWAPCPPWRACEDSTHGYFHFSLSKVQSSDFQQFPRELSHDPSHLHQLPPHWREEKLNCQKNLTVIRQFTDGARLWQKKAIVIWTTRLRFISNKLSLRTF